MTNLSVPKLLRTASFRFAGLYVALFIASSLILGATVFIVARSALEQQMVARVTTETSFLRAEFESGGLDRLIAIVSLRGRGSGALDYLVQARDGTALAGEIPAGQRRPGWTTIALPAEIEEDGRPERVLALASELGDGRLLLVGDDLGQIGELEESIGSALAWAVGLAAILGIGGGVLLSRTFLARVDAISRTAEAIIGGDLAQRVPVRGTGDDLDRLAGTLNHMLDRISTLMESLRQISTDVAHDLRTPLSRLYQHLEEVRTHAASVPEYEIAVEAAMREAEGLLETFSALLRIAQVEGASPRALFRSVDLSSVAESIADAYRPDAEDCGQQLDSSIKPGITVHGDQELLTQALANLVENALRHTPGGTRIELRLETDDISGVRLTVKDDGPGVERADLPRLTGRFYRGESSRTTPGNGLGLSLVAAVAELHHASLLLETGPPGFRATMRFQNVLRGVEVTSVGCTIGELQGK
jgi:signal transduction histidine kinase